MDDYCYTCDDWGEICDNCQQAADACECDDPDIVTCPDCGG